MFAERVKNPHNAALALKKVDHISRSELYSLLFENGKEPSLMSLTL